MISTSAPPEAFSSTLAAIVASFIVRFTARLMLGAQTIGIFSAAACSRRFCGSSNPVVAITNGRPCCRHKSVAASAPAGSEKSTSTSASAFKAAVNATPSAGTPASGPASWPNSG